MVTLGAETRQNEGARRTGRGGEPRRSGCVGTTRSARRGPLLAAKHLHAQFSTPRSRERAQPLGPLLGVRDSGTFEGVVAPGSLQRGRHERDGEAHDGQQQCGLDEHCGAEPPARASSCVQGRDHAPIVVKPDQPDQPH